MPEHFYCPSTAREAVLGQQRDIPTYNKYVLTPETKEALKTPQFDVWQWEPNEMLSLLEEMFHELGLVEELDIHPSTLKRFDRISISVGGGKCCVQIPVESPRELSEQSFP